MKTSLLLRFSLIVALVGVFLIIVLANNLEPKITKVSDIDSRYLDRFVKVQGYVGKIKVYEGLSVVTLKGKDAGTIKVVSYQKLYLSERSFIEVVGRVIEYREELEIEANKIEIL